MMDIPELSYDNRYAVDMYQLTPAEYSNFRPAYRDKLKKRARELAYITSKNRENRK
ncbi:hypothetical protein VPHD148_0071 [Vibrio phage D148]